MSRIGKKKIKLPPGVEVKLERDQVRVKGPKGVLDMKVPDQIGVRVEDGGVLVERRREDRPVRALHGTVRNQIQNMVKGVTDGFTRVLEINGVGYRAQIQGKKITLSLGYSHPVTFDLPQGVDASLEKQTIITIKGVNRYLVGQVAANIRSLRGPEPYKGKGIKYAGEVIRRKEGKTGKGKA